MQVGWYIGLSLVHFCSLTHCIHTGRVFNCYMLGKSICHLRDVYSILMENPVTLSEQCRPHYMASDLGLPGSALFAYDPQWVSGRKLKNIMWNKCPYPRRRKVTCA